MPAFTPFLTAKEKWKAHHVSAWLCLPHCDSLKLLATTNYALSYFCGVFHHSNEKSNELRYTLFSTFIWNYLKHSLKFWLCCQTIINQSIRKVIQSFSKAKIGESLVLSVKGFIPNWRRKYGNVYNWKSIWMETLSPAMQIYLNINIRSCCKQTHWKVIKCLMDKWPSI